MNQRPSPFLNTHYGLLGLHPSASEIAIRRAYRELSKKYHPDTTDLPLSEAKQKFQTLNEAYHILANPDRRYLYDLEIGYSRWHVIHNPLHGAEGAGYDLQRSAYIDSSDRPLSSGEIFALFLMGFTLFFCTMLVFFLSWLKT